MNRRKLIRKLAIPAAVIFVVSIIGLIILIPIDNWQKNKHNKMLNTHLNNLITQNQEFLKQLAIEFSQNQPNMKDIIFKTQLQLSTENQQPNQTKRYIWLTDTDGNFIFGAPKDVFEKLKPIYESRAELLFEFRKIKNHDDFFNLFICEHQRIHQAVDDFIDYNRYYRRFSKHTRLISSPVLFNNDQTSGTLYLKIDDQTHSSLYYHKGIANDLAPVFGIFAFISGIFLWFLLPTWVYIDAKQRDAAYPGAWAFLSLISLIFGLVIYLVTRPETIKSLHCPKCENELNGAGAFCPHCGFDLSTTVCPECQYPIKQEWGFCPSCRAELKKDIEEQSSEEEKKDENEEENKE